MITRLRLENFKTWEETGDLPLAPITGFFGANSSGKTSLFQALLLLKQTAESADRGLALHFGDDATLVNLGDFASVVCRHATSKALSIALGWSVPKALHVSDTARADRLVIESKDLSFAATVAAENGAKRRGPRISVTEMAYSVGDARFGMRRMASKGAGEYEVFSDAADFQFLRPPKRPSRVPPPSKCYGFPDQARAYLQNAGFLADLELALEDLFRRVYYLGPLRAYPKRQYTWAGARPSDMGRAGEQAIDAILSARDRQARISPGPRKRKVLLEQYVAQWLEKLDLIYDFRVEAVVPGSQIFQVKVRKAPGSPEVLITDVGFGVSQILPVVVLCFYVPEGSTVILEQPEIHLHPAVQAGLADVLIDASRKRNVQILLESHSEHLLRRLQRRLAEENLDQREVALYFCESTGEVSTVRSLDLDAFGNITNYPADFFGDQLGEIAEMAKAQLRRRMGAA